VSKVVRSFLAILLGLALLAGSSLAGTAPTQPLGQVLQSNGGHVGQAPAAVGATIFSGDILSTEERGSLHAKTAGARLYLLARSSASLQASDQGAAATLLSGTMIFSAATPQAFELRASTARLRAKTNAPTIAQVTLLGPKELLVTCRRGEVEFAVNEESDVIPEGASYRVLIDPPAALTSHENPQPPRKSGRQRKGFIFLLAGTVGGFTIWAVHEALESPDQP
jgi:ferric-dicitrate binding protein FerR (iron transport regulator)